MPLVTAPLANFISGVSQQPPAMRTATSAAAMTNAWASVVSGLQKRNGTEHIANLGTWGASGSTIGHVIDHDAGYRYIALVKNSQLRVYDLNGVQQTVTFPNGDSYLGSNDPVQSFRFLTIADTTFILNRNAVVAADNFGEEGTSTYTPSGTVAAPRSLPTAASGNLGQVYYTTSTAEYWKCVSTPGTAATYDWFSTGSTTNFDPRGDDPSQQVYQGSLPPATSAGQTAWIMDSGDNDSPSHFFQYQSAQTSAGTSTTYSWVKVSLASLTVLNPSRKDPANLGTIYVTQSIANSYYAVYVNNVLKASFLTANGTDAANSVQSTTVIATSLATALNASGYTTTQVGSTVVITNLATTDILKPWSTNGDKATKAYRNEIASYSDLPPSEIVGRIVRVKGDLKQNGDDYYVIYTATGQWQETYGYNEGARLQASTMPHVLVRNFDGTWTFKRHVWNDRIAGDSDSNIHPSFVGEKITDLCLFSGRLGFLTETNIILSESQTFENFYRKTLATLVDSDRLDFSVLSTTNDSLRHVIPFNKDLLILGDRSQYRFTYNNFLGPKNVQIQYTAGYSVAANVKPVNMGASVYFADDGVSYNYAKVFEFFPRPLTQGDDADEATAPVPQILKSGVRFLAGAPSVNTLIVGTDGAPSSLLVYNFYWTAQKKVQNAWSTWTFNDCTKVHWAGFSQNHLYLLLERPSGLSLEKVRLDEDIFDFQTGSHVLLDRLVPKSKLTVSYDAGTGLSTISLPYSTTGVINVVTNDGTGQVWQPVTPISSSGVTVPGNITALDIWAGIGFDFLFQFSPLFLRFTKGTGEVVNMDGRTQVRRLTLTFAKTRYFKTKIKLPGRPEFEHVYDMPTQDGSVHIPLMGRNLDIVLKIVNGSPFACAFSGGEFQALYTPKAQRMRGG